ncbi:hypothetical protein GOBAR_DD18079 [Gossypium barbadense]|nr:hypothetical protein GOBAR_DD18079 [Gossypium barbadense]
MELVDDDDLATIIAIYCPLEIENPADGDEWSDSEDQSHHDLEQFSDPNLDEVPNDIDNEGMVEDEDLHPYSTGNMGFDIVIRNDLGAHMSNVDPDAAYTCELLKYLDIVPAHLLEVDLEVGELFVGQQFYNKKDCVHVIKQYSLKLSMDYKRTQIWTIRKLEGPYTCTVAHMTQDHRKLDAKTIYNCIMPLNMSYNELQGWIVAMQEYVLGTVTDL